MSVILVVEQDASSANKIANALRADGLEVQTVESGDAAIQTAAAHETRLVLISAEITNAKELLSGFSRRRGGPGSVALVPDQDAASASASDYDADEVLSAAASDRELSSLVEKCLAASPVRPTTSAKSDNSKQLTSADIFGDVLAEVEAEAQTRPKPKRRAPRESDIQSKLEATLSGVMPSSGQPTKVVGKKRKVQATGDIDSLLDKTLSSLEMPKKKKAPSGPAPVVEKVKETPQPAAPSSPPEETASLESVESLEPPSAVPEPTPEPIPEPAKVVAPTPAPEPPSFEAADDIEDGGPKAALDNVLQLRGEDQFRTQALPTIPKGAESAEGTNFGDYTLLKRIAVGGMAEVWLARRRGVEGFQKTVAIKKILMHLTGTADFVTMFIDEAKLAAQLNHNNIIQIYDLGKVDDDFFIAMEYVDGKDLRSILTRAKDIGHAVPLEVALMVVAAVARALDYAHRKRDFDNRAMGLVHRDVSPQNVLISHEGEIKLCDFGIVKAVAKASITQMGALKGKLQYMSPEQAWGKPVDSRSDLFSLGSVLFELLTGDKLFTGDSEIGVLDAVRDCRIRSPRDLVADIPEDVVKIVKKALAKDPGDRYQTAGEMEKDLTAVLNVLEPAAGQNELADYLRELYQTGPKATKQATPTAPTASDSQQPPKVEAVDQATAPPKKKSRAPLIAVGALVAAAVIAVVAIQFGGLMPPSSPSPGDRAPSETETQTPATPPVAQSPTPESAFSADAVADGETDPTASEEATEGDTESADPQAADNQTAGSSDGEQTEPQPAEGGETDADADPQPVLADGESAPASGEGADADASNEDVDVQQLVEEELARRKEALQQSLEAEFEKEKQRLEEEIAKAKDDGGETSDDPKDNE